MRSRARFRVGRTPEPVVAAGSGDIDPALEEVLAIARQPLLFEAVVPASEHYRPAETPEISCGTCRSFTADSTCTMFPGDPPVQAGYVCDDWNADDAGAERDADS